MSVHTRAARVLSDCLHELVTVKLAGPHCALHWELAACLAFCAGHPHTHLLQNCQLASGPLLRSAPLIALLQHLPLPGSSNIFITS